MHAWSLSCFPEKLDALLEQLSDLDPTRLVIVRTPGKKRQAVEFFSETKRQALALQKIHGGEVREINNDWQTASPPRAPIAIRGRFLLVESAGSPCDEREIVIPLGMAFGTGDHPTTASCLRLLCDVSKQLGACKWSFLDVGTGSGLLAIAAKKLGANPIAAFDYDSQAIRTARENARLNRVRGIQWSRQDLLNFDAPKSHQVVAANIFSELFLATWPRIRRAVAPGGYFILSGILRFQADDCRRALEKARYTILREVRLGKWVTFLAQG